MFSRCRGQGYGAPFSTTKIEQRFAGEGASSFPHTLPLLSWAARSQECAFSHLIEVQRCNRPREIRNGSWGYGGVRAGWLGCRWFRLLYARETGSRQERLVPPRAPSRAPWLEEQLRGEKTRKETGRGSSHEPTKGASVVHLRSKIFAQISRQTQDLAA